MPAYLIADVEITDTEAYSQYTLEIGRTIQAHQGRYLVRGGDTEVLEGDWTPKRVVVIEFPDSSSLRAWYGSDDYEPLKRLRQRSANSRLLLVEGV